MLSHKSSHRFLCRVIRRVDAEELKNTIFSIPTSIIMISIFLMVSPFPVKLLGIFIIPLIIVLAGFMVLLVSFASYFLARDLMTIEGISPYVLAEFVSYAIFFQFLLFFYFLLGGVSN